MPEQKMGILRCLDYQMELFDKQINQARIRPIIPQKNYLPMMAVTSVQIENVGRLAGMRAIDTGTVLFEDGGWDGFGVSGRRTMNGGNWLVVDKIIEKVENKKNMKEIDNICGPVL
jgi:hypothetical protein